MQVRECTDPAPFLKGSLKALVPKGLEEVSLSQTGIGKVLAKQLGWKSWEGCALAFASSTQLSHTHMHRAGN